MSVSATAPTPRVSADNVTVDGSPGARRGECGRASRATFKRRGRASARTRHSSSSFPTAGRIRRLRRAEETAPGLMFVATLADERCRSVRSARVRRRAADSARPMPRKAAPRRNDVAGAVPAEDARRVRGASSGDDAPAKRGRFAGRLADHRGARLVPRGGDALVIATVAGVPTRDDDAVSIPPPRKPHARPRASARSAGDRVRWRFLRHAPDDASAPDRDPDPDGLAWRAERPPTEDAAVAFIALVRDGTLAVVGPADPSGALSVERDLGGARRPRPTPRRSPGVAKAAAARRSRRLAPPSTRRGATSRRGLETGSFGYRDGSSSTKTKMGTTTGTMARSSPVPPFRPRGAAGYARRGASSRGPRRDTPRASRRVRRRSTAPRYATSRGRFPRTRSHAEALSASRGRVDGAPRARRRRRRDQTRRIEGRFVRRLGRVSRVRDAPVVERASHGRSGTSSVRQLVHGPDDVGSIPASARRSRRHSRRRDGTRPDGRILHCVLATSTSPCAGENEGDADDDGDDGGEEDVVQGEDSKLDVAVKEGAAGVRGGEDDPKGAQGFCGFEG